MEWYDKLIDSFKEIFSPRFTIAICISSFILLFLDKYISFLYIDQIVAKYKPYIGVVFIIFFCLSIVDLFFYLSSKYAEYQISDKANRKKIIKHLSSLNSDEKAIFRESFFKV